MINVSADPLKAAGKLLNRLKFTKSSLPVLSHLRFQAVGDRLAIAATTLDQCLETTLPLADPLDGEECFLIPSNAFKAALKADKGSVVSFALRGRKGDRTVKLGVTTGGITVETHHPTLEFDEFQQRPEATGTPVEIPARTIEMMGLVSSCASNDETRHILNGVLFTPEDGGMVVAVDGRRLGAAPATVPATGFVLPNPAVHVLRHPEFCSTTCSVTLWEDAKDGEEAGDRRVRFESGNHLLVSRTIDGNYPAWKQVVPKEMIASVTIPEDRRKALISWLRTLSARDHSVLISRTKRREVRLTQTVDDGNAASVSLPADITGEPAAVALNPAYLADALTIAPCLWITGGNNPVVTRRADGAFAVVMPMRVNGSETRAAA